jgi:DNA polymerase III alpha subunit (gram-positive type)
MQTQPVFALDFETSGYCHNLPSKAVEIGLCRLHPNGYVEILARSLLSGAQAISYHATKTHGICLWHCKNKPPLAAFKQKLQTLHKQNVIVHAKGTERKILSELLPEIEPNWIDTLPLARKSHPHWPNFQLETICTQLGVLSKLQRIFPRGHWHQAIYDATAAALAWRELTHATQKP